MRAFRHLPAFVSDGAVQDMPEFQKAWGCKPGQPMVTEKACRVW